MDLWRRIRKHATERELLIVGRVFIAVMCGLSILWIPLVKSSQSGQLFVYIQAVQGYLGTPIGALFLFSILWKRMNEHGAFWGILIGHVCGIIRMVLDFVYPAPDCGEPETRPPVVYNVHYTYFCQMNLVITSLSIVIISLLTKPLPKEKLNGMTWWTRARADDIDVEEITLKPRINGAMEQSAVDEEDSESVGTCRKWTDFVCGIPKKAEEHSLEEEAAQKKVFLKENRFWSKILNINAGIGLVIVAFLIGFFR